MGLFDILPKILIPAAVVVAFVLLRRFVPPGGTTRSMGKGRPSLKALDQRFSRTELAVSAVALSIGALFVAGSWTLLQTTNRWIAALDGPAAFRLYPSEAIWFFFPGFGALTLSWNITARVLPRMLGSEASEDYLYWTDARVGMNTRKVFRWGALLIAGPIGLLSVLALPVHTSFLEDAIVFRSYGSARREIHPYRQIRALTTTDGWRNMRGEFVADPCILIDFEDGTQWSSGDLLRDPDPEINSSLKSFLTRRSAIPFHHVAILKDLSAE